jgi:hypothetical protein
VTGVGAYKADLDVVAHLSQAEEGWHLVDVLGAAQVRIEEIAEETHAEERRGVALARLGCLLDLHT